MTVCFLLLSRVPTKTHPGHAMLLGADDVYYPCVALEGLFAAQQLCMAYEQ